jgi:hypothetical protein
MGLIKEMLIGLAAIVAVEAYHNRTELAERLQENTAYWCTADIGLSTELGAEPKHELSVSRGQPVYVTVTGQSKKHPITDVAIKKNDAKIQAYASEGFPGHTFYGEKSDVVKNPGKLEYRVTFRNGGGYDCEAVAKLNVNGERHTGKTPYHNLMSIGAERHKLPDKQQTREIYQMLERRTTHK